MLEPTMTEVADTATVPEGATHTITTPPPPRTRSRIDPAAAVAARAARSKRFPWGRAIFLLLCVAGAATYVAVRGPARAESEVKGLATRAYHAVAGAPKTERVEPAPAPKAAEVWDRMVTITEAERKTIGFRIVPVVAQTKPIELELNGTTDYDQNTLTKIRPLFDARVTSVFRSTGQSVKKGEPLIELHSTALATDKADLRTKYVQWDHDRKLLESRRSLAANGQITNVIWVDTQNSEKNSRVVYDNARKKLEVVGVPTEEIDKLLSNLGDDPKINVAEADIEDISKLILRAPIDGMIVEREVVSGNFYDDMAVLMVISPMDKLWVWGNVFEKDQSSVHLGQTWEVDFPYLDEKIEGHVEHISTKVDPVTRTLKIRATIPNPKKQFFAEMLVRAVLQIPPVPGQTVIPRNALSVINRENCVFVQKVGSPDKFERRIIEVDQERSDHVVVRSGLKPGEMVVSSGSLILSQLYEDASTLNSGLPL